MFPPPRALQEELGHQTNVIRQKYVARKSTKIRDLNSGQRTEPGEEFQVALDPLSEHGGRDTRVEDVFDIAITHVSVGRHLKVKKDNF